MTLGLESARAKKTTLIEARADTPPSEPRRAEPPRMQRPGAVRAGSEQDRGASTVLFGTRPRHSLPRGVASGAKGLDLAALRAQIAQDIERGFSCLESLTPAVTLYGGARFQPGSRTYELARDIGFHLATHGHAVRTGAGPGVMGAGAEGAQMVLADKRVVSGSPDLRPQGFNIKLEHEQKVHPAVAFSQEMQQFLIRKPMLWENACAHGFLPGGFGTLDELFESWSAAAQGRLADPMSLIGTSFWTPVMEVLEKIAVHDRPLIDRTAFELMPLVDTAVAFVDRIGAPGHGRGFDVPAKQLKKRFVEDTRHAIDRLARLPEAVTVIGGRGLAPADPTVSTLTKLATQLTAAGVSMRIGGTGAVADATREGARAADPNARPQVFMQTADGKLPSENSTSGDVVVREPAVHKAVLALRSRGVVVLPGGLGTLSELFGVLCQIQCGKLDAIPVVLVGSDYWKPLIAVLKAQLLLSPEPTISPGDLDLVTIVDSAAEAMKLLEA